MLQVKPEQMQWQALEVRALEPAVRAALEHLPARQRPHLHMVEGKDGRLLCVAALKHEGWRWPPLGRIATSRWGDFFFLGLPLVDEEQSEAALRDLLHSVRHAGMAALELRAIPANGPFMQGLRAVLAEMNTQPLELARWQRAALDATRTPEDWWQQDIKGKRRGEWSRRKRKLEKEGELTCEALPKDAPTEILQEWMEDFLRLEAAGWKGRNGTALLCDEHNAAFVRAMTAGFHAAGNLRFWRLRLDGRTIAANFGLVSGTTFWGGKTAYDETLHRYSPGVLLIIELTRDLLADPSITFADSSADPDHPMIDHIWKQRLEMADVLVPLPGISAARFKAIAATEHAYRQAREQAKKLYYRLKGRSRKPGSKVKAAR